MNSHEVNWASEKHTPGTIKRQRDGYLTYSTKSLETIESIAHKCTNSKVFIKNEQKFTSKQLLQQNETAYNSIVYAARLTKKSKLLKGTILRLPKAVKKTK